MEPQDQHAGIEQLVEAQMERWERRKQKEPDRPRGPVVAIAMQAGSLGHELGEAVAEALDLDFHAEDIIHEIAKRTHSTDRIVASLDDRDRSFIEEWLLSAEGLDPLRSEDYGRQLVRLVRTIERHGDAVVVGHGASLLVDPDTNLRVRVVSPIDVRVDRLRLSLGVSAKEARKHAEGKDRDHRHFLRQYFDVASDSLDRYDLTLNDSHLPLDVLVSIVCSAVEGVRLSLDEAQP